MKRKELFAILTAMCMLSGGITPTYARVESTQEITKDTTSASVNVSAEIANFYTVTLPKTIKLDPDTKDSGYSLTVKGDIAGNENITVIPDTTFTMETNGKDNVTANVTQEKTAFTYEEAAANDGKGTTTTGSVEAGNLTAGTWTGTFNFNVACKEEVYEELTLTADNLANYVDADTNEEIATSGDVVIPSIVKDKSSGQKYQVTGLEGYDSGYGIFKNIFGHIIKYDTLDENVNSIVLPKSLKSINKCAFIGCSNLTSIDISKNVISIGNNAFENCTNLTSVNISDGVISIGNNAFENCEKLKSINIPESVTSIGKSAFISCSALESIVVSSENTFYDSRNDCNAIIETKTNTLLTGCKNTIIPDSIACIKQSAFYGQSELTSITIPNSVKVIECSAFDECINLKTINLSNNIEKIGDYAFKSCKKITSIIYKDITYSDKNVLVSKLKEDQIKGIAYGSCMDKDLIGTIF